MSSKHKLVRSLALVLVAVGALSARPAQAQEVPMQEASGKEKIVRPKGPAVGGEGPEGRADGPRTNTAALDAKLAELTGREGGLTSNQVAKQVTSTSPDVASKQAEVEYAALQMDRALADFFPRLAFSAKYTRLNSVDGGSLGPFVVAPNAAEGPLPEGTQLVNGSMELESINNQFSFQATLTIPLSDYVLRLVQARDAADHNANAAKLNVVATARRVDLDARVAYYSWVKAELSVTVAEQSLTLAEEQLARIKVFVDAGAATFADQSSAVALVASSRLLLIKSRNLASLSRTQLAVRMHTEEDVAAAFVIGEDFAATIAQPAKLVRPVELGQEALASRPELGSIREKIAYYGSQADVTRSKAYPRLDAFASIAALNPDQRVFPSSTEFHTSWQLGLSLSYSPNDTADGVLSAAQVDAQARSTNAQAVALEDAILLEVAQARSSYLDAQASVESTAVSLAAAEEAYRSRHELFLHDRATSVELTQAHSDLLRARLDAVSARVGLHVASASLAYAVGRDGGR